MVEYFDSIDLIMIQSWWSRISDEAYTEITFAQTSSNGMDLESVRSLLCTIGHGLLVYMKGPNDDDSLRETLRSVDAKLKGRVTDADVTLLSPFSHSCLQQRLGL